MTRTAPDLLPCPFCGGEADIRYNWAATVGVFCQKCGGQSCYFATEALAIAAWNTRADRWIPVTERLPEKEGAYYVVLKDGNVGHTWFPSPRRDWHAMGVTHWMPLPLPPKEVEG